MKQEFNDRENKKDEDSKLGIGISIGLAIGTGLGVVYGVVFDKFALGISMEWEPVR